MASSRFVNIENEEDLHEYFYFEHGNECQCQAGSDNEGDYDETDEDEEQQETREIEGLRRALEIENRGLRDQNNTDDSQNDDDINNTNVPTQPQNTGIDYKQLSRCSCPQFCLAWVDDIDTIRAYAESLVDKAQLDIMVLGKLSVLINRSEKTSGIRHGSKDRQLSRAQYYHEGE